MRCSSQEQQDPHVLARTKTNRVAAILLVWLLLLAADCRSPESEVDHLAQVLALRPGFSVADVGAGFGEVSIALAAHVAPGGRVYATEIDPVTLRKIRLASRSVIDSRALR